LATTRFTARHATAASQQIANAEALVQLGVIGCVAVGFCVYEALSFRAFTLKVLKDIFGQRHAQAVVIGRITDQTLKDYKLTDW